MGCPKWEYYFWAIDKSYDRFWRLVPNVHWYFNGLYGIFGIHYSSVIYWEVHELIWFIFSNTNQCKKVVVKIPALRVCSRKWFGRLGISGDDFYSYCFLTFQPGFAADPVFCSWRRMSWHGVVFRFVFNAKEKAATICFVTAWFSGGGPTRAWT